MGTHENVSDVVNMGDFSRKYLGMDPKQKRKVSRKALTRPPRRKEKSNQILVY
jgi:hypothetical protein